MFLVFFIAAAAATAAVLAVDVDKFMIVNNENKSYQQAANNCLFDLCQAPHEIEAISIRRWILNFPFAQHLQLQIRRTHI